jgi:biopolymer transport protein ExbB
MSQEGKMSRFAIVLSLVLLPALAHAQENYSTWANAKRITINTSASGANITAPVANYPLLVRLTASNAADVFTGAKAGGADLRFRRIPGPHLPYEIERWDSAGQVAEIWVLMDTVRANDTAQALWMYWGKADAVAASSGPAVFGPTLGFVGVWHMEGGTGNTADATGGNNPGVPVGTVTGGAGAIGLGRVFDGSGVIAVPTAASSTAFDVEIASSFTISAWFNASNWTGDPRILQRGGTAPKYGLYDTAGFFFFHTNHTGRAAASEPLRATASPSTGTWHSAHGVYGNGAATLYVDGAVAGTLAATGTITVSTFALIIGGKPTSAAGTGSQNMFTGSIDEVRVHGAARSESWVKLDHETQKAGSTVLALGATQAPASVRGARSPSGGAFSVRADSRGLVFRLPGGGRIMRIAVMDTRGRIVWTRAVPADGGEVAWNGDAGVRRASPGIYMVRAVYADAPHVGAFEERVVFAP